jgi:hypothetical protein
MACNCEGKVINIGMGCCVPVVANANHYYTKSEVDEKLDDIVTSGCCITPEEVDDKISAATSGFATEQWVSSFTYDKQTIDQKVASGGTFDPTQYYTTGQTDNLLSLKLDASAYTPCDLSNYYNKTEVENIVNSAKTEVEGEIPSLSGYATEQWVLDKHYISGVDLSDYALKSEIPTVPTSNSAFTNDMGYLTEHQSLSAYSTTQEVTNMINQSVSGKQDTLSAGTGIDITNNVISATGGGGATYSAGRGINIDTANTISVSLPISASTGTDSLAANESTLTTNEAEFAIGKYNYTTSASTTFGHSGNTLFTVGNGTSANDKHNAFEVRQNGDIYIRNGENKVMLQTELNNKANSSTLNNYLLKSKIWCGTQAQYDAIQNKDSETLYLIHA